MSPQPLVSIGVPVYNGERFLDQALDALLSQTFTDFEIVICDNASGDATQEICERYAATHPRVSYFRHATNLGAAHNYNSTFHRAAGRYFKWLAHDDLIADRFLERCLDRLESDTTGAALAFSKMRFIDEDGEVTGEYDAPMSWDGATPVSRLHSLLLEPLAQSYAHRCHPLLGLIRSDLLRKTRLIGGYNSSDKVALVELALLGDFIEVPEYLFLRRIHAATSLNASTSARDVARWFDRRARHWFVAPRSRLFVEYARSVMRADIPFREKLNCTGLVMRMLKRDWRILGGETRNAFMDAVRPREPGR